jgi:outer membrane protein assembly factor BamB
MEVWHYYGSHVLEGDFVVTGGELMHLAVLDASSGDPVWHREVLDAEYASGLITEGDRIYVATNQGAVRCLDLHSGELLWSFEVGDDLLDMTPFRRGARSILAAPVRFRDLVIVCGVDGALYALEAERGSLVSRTQFDAPITAAPSAIDDGIIVGTWDGRLYRFAA